MAKNHIVNMKKVKTKEDFDDALGRAVDYIHIPAVAFWENNLAKAGKAFDKAYAAYYKKAKEHADSLPDPKFVAKLPMEQTDEE